MLLSAQGKWKNIVQRVSLLLSIYRTPSHLLLRLYLLPSTTVSSAQHIPLRSGTSHTSVTATSATWF